MSGIPEALLVPFDPEIERAFHKRRRERRGLAKVEEMDDYGAAHNGHNDAAVEDDPDRAIRDYVVPILEGLNPHHH